MAPLPARQSIDERLAGMLSADACPLCRFREDAARRYLDSLLWESVNDRDFRGRLAKGGGFCRIHAGQLIEADRRSTGGSLGAAILLATGLRQRLGRLEGLSAGHRRRLARALADARQAPTCPVCARVAEADRDAGERLVALVAEPTWAAALGSAGFCLDDLTAIWSVAASTEAGHRTWSPVAAAQLERLRRLLGRIDAYVDHSSHDTLHLQADEERRSLREVTRALAGDQGAQRDR
jgi:hypothetical protein